MAQRIRGEPIVQGRECDLRLRKRGSRSEKLRKVRKTNRRMVNGQEGGFI
jgi:hypothetical protein